MTGPLPRIPFPVRRAIRRPRARRLRPLRRLR